MLGKIKMKASFLVHRDRIVYMQTRVKTIMNNNLSRLATLDMIWQNEVKQMESHVLKKKK